jgi:hypothetical protein
MENKFRNEMEINLAGQKILLRPTFENIAAMEANVGSLVHLVWKFSRGAVKSKSVTEKSVASFPSLSECAQIIYYNQAAVKPEDPTLKKYSLEEIWDMVLDEGATACKGVVEFLGKMMAGRKVSPEELLEAEEEKKS